MAPSARTGGFRNCSTIVAFSTAVRMPRRPPLAMDKVAAKQRFVEAGIPTPRFDVVAPDRSMTCCEHGPPRLCSSRFRKASSVDCVMAFDQPTFARELRRLADRYRQCLIEEYIKGPELTVGILGGEALPPIQIRTKRAFYNTRRNTWTTTPSICSTWICPRRWSNGSGNSVSRLTSSGVS